jgi:hypothetical protein
MYVIEDLKWREFLTYTTIYYYIQYHQPQGYGVLKFEVSCMWLYALKEYCWFKYDYQEYYHWH